MEETLNKVPCFDKSTLKKSETQEKNKLPTKEGMFQVYKETWRILTQQHILQHLVHIFPMLTVLFRKG